MSLQIQMLGTGSAFAKMYYNTSALIRSNELTILIDCGQQHLNHSTKSVLELDQIDGITHFAHSC